jgi:hypothetical protein
MASQKPYKAFKREGFKYVPYGKPYELEGEMVMDCDVYRGFEQDTFTGRNTPMTIAVIEQHQ